jgi:hypothetical protein
MRNICCMLCDVRLCLCSVAAAPSRLCLVCAPYHCSTSAYVRRHSTTGARAAAGAAAGAAARAAAKAAAEAAARAAAKAAARAAARAVAQAADMASGNIWVHLGAYGSIRERLGSKNHHRRLGTPPPDIPGWPPDG